MWKKRIQEESTSPSVSAIRKDEDEDVYMEKVVKEEAERHERSEKKMNLIILNVGDHVLRKIELCTLAASTYSNWRDYIFQRLYRIEFTCNTYFIHSRWLIFGVWMRILMTS